MESGFVTLELFVCEMSQIVLRGMVACITGASRGIGAGIARALAKEGCRLGICSRKEADIEQLKKELEREGCKVVACQVDVTSMEQVYMTCCIKNIDDTIPRCSSDRVWHH